MSSGHYGVSYKINGHRIGHILRLGKEYHLVFERCYEENTLEEIEKIDWQQVIVEPVRENYLACDLPEGYSFVVKDINYLRNTDSFEVILEVDKQYWGDVTPYWIAGGIAVGGIVAYVAMNGYDGLYEDLLKHLHGLAGKSSGNV